MTNFTACLLYRIVLLTDLAPIVFHPRICQSLCYSAATLLSNHLPQLLKERDVGKQKYTPGLIETVLAVFA